MESLFGSRRGKSVFAFVNERALRLLEGFSGRQCHYRPTEKTSEVVVDQLKVESFGKDRFFTAKQIVVDVIGRRK